jgi:uncharacterized membrane protein SirB2
MYTGLKHLHMLCAVISITGFTLRGAWMLGDSAMLQKKWVKIAPHIVDTILLATAFAMAYQISLYPFTSGWLTAKFLGLLVYIALGMIALKRGKTKSVRATAFFAAIAVFAYITVVARTKNPLFFL